MNLRKNRKLKQPAKVDPEKATAAAEAAPLQTMVVSTAAEPVAAVPAQPTPESATASVASPSPKPAATRKSSRATKPAKNRKSTGEKESDSKWWSTLEGARVLRSYKLHPAVLDRLEVVAKVERSTMATVVEEALIERIRAVEKRYERETGSPLPVLRPLG